MSQSTAFAQIWTREEGAWRRADIEGLDAELDLSALGVSLPLAEV